MIHDTVRKATLVAGTCAVLMAIGTDAAWAGQPGYGAPPPGYGDRQDAPPPGYDDGPDTGPPPQGYDGQQGGPPPGNGYPSGYDNGGPPPAGYPAAPQPPAPPPGYDGTRPPPPPPGYQPDPRAAADQQAQDQRYAAYAQQWEQAYCVKAHGNAGEGAVLGGVVGALLGSGVAGRGSRGAGAVLGAGVGAVGGAAIAGSANSNATSPGCPPGYVVRGGAPAFAYGGYSQPYLYAAPAWYQPWVFYGGAWTYRPYPYHVWYYGHYGWHGGYGPRGYYRGRGWYRHP